MKFTSSILGMLLVNYVIINTNAHDFTIVQGQNRNIEFKTSGIHVWYDKNFLHVEDLAGEAISKYPNNIFVSDYVESPDGNRVLLMLSERVAEHRGASNPFDLLLVEKINGRFWTRRLTPRTSTEIDFFPFKFRNKKSDFQKIEVEIGIKTNQEDLVKYVYTWATLNADTAVLSEYEFQINNE